MDCRRQSPQRADGSDVEDTSFPLPDHFLVDRLGDRKQAVDIGMNHFIPGAVCGGSEIVTTVDSCVIDEHVDAAPKLNYLPRHSLHTQTIGYRYLERERAPAQRFNLAAHFGGQIVS